MTENRACTLYIDFPEATETLKVKSHAEEKLLAILLETLHRLHRRSMYWEGKETWNGQTAESLAIKAAYR